MPTQRLYFSDPQIQTFSASVVSCQPHAGNWLIELDKTAFYPTGGGQPNDTGRLGSAQVIDCFEEADRIVHLCTAPLEGEVLGQIDHLRRQDHMQQHTGQHILSQAFIQVAGAETRSFHLGVDSSTIDVEIDRVTPELLSQVESVANTIVFENRPVHIHLAEDGKLDHLPLRKQTDREGCLRVIEIAGFDWSPCGGTHARQTGEVGLIAIRSTERVKGNLVRIEFLCGQRVLNDYHQAHQTALATAGLFSAARDAAPALVERLQTEAKQLQKRVRELAETAVRYEGLELYQSVAETAGKRVVVKVFPGRDLEEVKLLAHAIVAAGPAVVFLAASGDTHRLIFARSPQVAVDCGKLLSEVCKANGGRGGGRPEFAQGGIPTGAQIEDLLQGVAVSV